MDMMDGWMDMMDGCIGRYDGWIWIDRYDGRMER